MFSNPDRRKTAGIAFVLVLDMNSEETDVAKLSGHLIRYDAMSH